MRTAHDATIAPPTIRVTTSSLRMASPVTAALGGSDLLVVETILAGSDEVCFWYVEAASKKAVTGAFESVGVPIDRTSRATALPDLRRLLRDPNPTARS
jgi:hypothetical protein